jgi:CHAT domain-containing protein
MAAPRTLLTVAPDYPEQVKRVGLWSQVRPLEHALKESRQVSRFFPKQVKALHGPAATKKQLVAHLQGRHVVHISAHGFADDRFGNKFGGLLLTPSAGQEGEDDNFLALHEIVGLRLSGCELAVLSACFTNVGPQPPLEAGVTLAHGFLAAGARRVVASHWGVDDESTAELMSAFFENLTAAVSGQPQSRRYAWALQQAQRHLRGRVGSSAPYFWAPFVLLGPAN